MNEVNWKYGKPCAVKIIDQVEDSLAVKFPREFLQIVLLHDGARPIPNEFDLAQRHGVVFHHLLPFSNTVMGSTPTVIETIKLLGDRLPAGYVPIGADPFGNYICFSFPKDKDGNLPLYFLDHEQENIHSAAFIANSFQELLDLLYETT